MATRSPAEIGELRRRAAELLGQTPQQRLDRVTPAPANDSWSVRLVTAATISEAMQKIFDAGFFALTPAASPRLCTVRP